jgi:hypothetical protein
MIQNATPDQAPVPTRFRVLGTFVLRSRSLFVVRGTVMNGTVRAGQRVVQPEGVDAVVGGVEKGLMNVGGGAEQTALTFRFTSPAQLARWQTLAPTGVELTLEEAPPARPIKRDSR